MLLRKQDLNDEKFCRWYEFYHYIRSFPFEITSRFMEGVLMGDQDHSAEVLQYVVNTGYEILREKTLGELSSLALGFLLPIPITDLFQCYKD